jgi:hypothetical protein
MPMPEEGRVCTRCKQFKIWSEFNKRAKGLNGYQPKCRQCQKEIEASYARDMDKHRAAMRKYQENLRRKKTQNDFPGND